MNIKLIIIISCIFISNFAQSQVNNYEDWYIDSQNLTNGKVIIASGQTKQINFTVEVWRFNDPNGGYYPVNFEFQLRRFPSDHNDWCDDSEAISNIFSVTTSDFSENESLATKNFTLNITAGNSAGELQDGDQILFFVEDAAYNCGGWQAMDEDYNVEVQEEAPTAPTNLVASNIKQTSCHLSWTKPAGTIDGYYIYQNGTEVKTVSNNSTSISNLSPSTTYTFRVSAYNSVGESSKSNPKQLTTTDPVPTTPTNFRVTDIGADFVLLNWYYPINSPIEKYNIYMNGTLIASVGHVPKVWIYKVEDLDEGTTYSFEISAVNNGGESEKSAPITATTGVRPSPPTNVNVVYTFPSLGYVLSWSSPTSGEVVGYNVYQVSPNAGKVYTTTGYGFPTGYYLDLKPGSMYVFCVSAYNEKAESGYSNNCVGFIAPEGSSSSGRRGDNSEKDLLSSGIMIDTQIENEKIAIYPNPLKDKLHVDGLMGEEFEVTIFDLSGNIIIKESGVINEVNLTGLSQGTYIVQIKTADKNIVQRIVKE